MSPTEGCGGARKERTLNALAARDWTWRGVRGLAPEHTEVCHRTTAWQVAIAC